MPHREFKQIKLPPLDLKLKIIFNVRRGEVVALFERIARSAAQRGHAVVIVAHDIDFVARCADRVLILRAGRALAEGPPARVLTSALVSRAFAVPVEIERTPGGAVVVRPAYAEGTRELAHRPR